MAWDHAERTRKRINGAKSLHDLARPNSRIKWNKQHDKDVLDGEFEPNDTLGTDPQQGKNTRGRITI